MKKLLSLFIPLIFLWLHSHPSVVSAISNTFSWLFRLHLTQTPISATGEIFVKVATWGITFCIVGVIFKKLKWFNSQVMSVTYCMISAIISFVLSYVVMLFEQYILTIAIILLTLVAVTAVIYFGYHFHRNTVKKKGD